jgi:hypothetical protein
MNFVKPSKHKTPFLLEDAANRAGYQNFEASQYAIRVF